MQIRPAVSQERIHELRARCEELRGQCRDLEARERSYADDARRNAQAAAEREQLVATLKAKHGKFRALSWLAAGATVAAAGTALALASPLVGVVAAGAAVGWMFAGREATRLDHGVHIVGFSAGNLSCLSSLDQAQVALLHQQQDTLGQQIAAFEAERRRLEVESLVASPAADFARVIDAGEDLVTIGGISLPRRHEQAERAPGG